MFYDYLLCFITTLAIFMEISILMSVDKSGRSSALPQFTHTNKLLFVHKFQFRAIIQYPFTNLPRIHWQRVWKKNRKQKWIKQISVLCIVSNKYHLKQERFIYLNVFLFCFVHSDIGSVFREKATLSYENNKT